MGSSQKARFLQAQKGWFFLDFQGWFCRCWIQAAKDKLLDQKGAWTRETAMKRHGSQGNLWTNIYSFLSFVSIVSSRIFCFRRFIIIVYDLIKLTEFTNSCSCSCWNFLKKHHGQTPSPSSQALQGSDESDITIEASAKFSSSVTDWAGDTALGTALSPSPLFGLDAQKKLSLKKHCHADSHKH